MERLQGQQNYQRNIKINYLFIFCMSLNITRGFWMIYLASKGMSLVELGFLEGMFHVTSFLMETPTGAIADLFGRKFSRILGRVFNIAYILLMLFGTSFSHFLLAFILCAVSWNLETGAGDALVYDSLAENKEEHTYMKVNGRIEMTYQVAQAAGLAIGGWIAAVSYGMLFAGELLLIGVSIGIALLFRETGIGREKTDGQKKSGFLESLTTQFTDCFSVVKGSSRLIYLIVFLNGIGVFTATVFFYMQIYCKENGLQEGTMGILFAASCVLGAVGGLSAHSVENWLKERRLLLSLPVIFMLILWGMVWFRTAVFSFLLLGLFDSITYVIYTDYVNRLIPSARRATLLSFSSMVFSFFMVIVFPVFGWIGDSCGLTYSFAFISCIATLLAAINLFILFQRKQTKKAN